MSSSIKYVIQASAAPVTAMVRVGIRCRGAGTAHRWRLEMPRLLWVSMGTEQAAVFITEQYFDAYPVNRDIVGLEDISQAVVTSLLDTEQYFDPDGEA